jgi:hypothetical protein
MSKSKKKRIYWSILNRFFSVVLELSWIIVIVLVGRIFTRMPEICKGKGRCSKKHSRA